MKRALFIVIVGGIVGVAVFRVWFFAEGLLAAQRAKDDRFITERLLPPAEVISKFRDNKGHLPSLTEFTELQGKDPTLKYVCYFPSKPASLATWGIVGRDFVVGVWRGEWMECYQSWDGKVFRRHDSPLAP